MSPTQPSSTSSARYVRWPLFYLLLGSYYVRCVLAPWPPSRPDSVHLLGIFRRAANMSVSASDASHARAMFNAAILLAQQYNMTVNGRFIEGRVIETEGNGIETLSSTCEAMTNASIVGIVGPALSRETHLVADFAQTVGLPVISYAATDPGLSDRTSYPAFHRTVPSDTVAALATAKLFGRYNWTSCIFIYQNDAFGMGGAQAVNNVFVERGLTVSDVLVFDILTRKLREDLKTLLIYSPSRIVLVWAEASFTRLILQEALDANVLGPLFTWILRSRLSLSSFSETARPNLVGMLVVEPVSGAVLDERINTTLLNAAYQIWAQNEPDSFPGPMQVSSYGLFAFDATWSLIQALQHLCSSACLSFNDSSSCFRRRFVHADSLSQAVATTAFLGVSGPIQFNENTTDRINGSYYGVWNARAADNEVEFALVLKYTDGGEWRAASQTDVIIWPGTSLTLPSGHAALTGVTLRVGMRESQPFTMLAPVTDASGNVTTKLIGFMPELLELLVERMGFIPDIQLASANQSYNDLIDDVANGSMT